MLPTDDTRVEFCVGSKHTHTHTHTVTTELSNAIQFSKPRLEKWRIKMDATKYSIEFYEITNRCNYMQSILFHC